MPTRTISTKLAIKEESEYRATLSRINSEIKSLQSALKLTESQFQTNANSMQALTAKGEALNNLYKAQKDKVDELRKALANAQEAEKKYTEQKVALEAQIKANNEKLEALKKTTGDTSAEEKKLSEENKELQKQLDSCNANLAAAEKGTNSWQTQLNNAQIKLNDLDAEIKLNDEYLKEAQDSADKCATSIDRFGDQVDNTTTKADELATALADAGVVQAVNKVVDALKECIDAAVEFEAEMAAVSRTTGVTNEVTDDTVITLDEMGDALKEMSAEMPITTSELASIATTAGQLGVAQENVVEFTRVMAMLDTTTDLTADDAATMLAQFSNITQMDPKNYDRLGSTVAALGDATATTASKIVDMAQGMAAVGSICGMSEADILAIAAAVGSVGIEAGAGSTAINQFLQNMQKAVKSGGDELEEFASVANMTAGEFRATWENNSAEAFAAVISGLGEMGDDSITELEKLGVTAARQQKAIQSLAQSGDNLTTCLSMASDAWDDNLALTEKAETMYGTTQAQIDIMNDRIGLLKEAVGEAFAPTIQTAAEKVGDFALALSEFVEEHPKVTQAIGAVVTAVAGLTTGLAAFQAAKKAANILELGTLFGKIGGAASSAVTAIGNLATALGGSLAVGLGEIAGIAGVAAASIYAIVDACKETQEAGYIGDGHSLEEYEENVRSCEAAVEDLKAQYEALSNSGADLTGIQSQLDTATIGLAHAQEELANAQSVATEVSEEFTGALEDTAEAADTADGATEDIIISLENLAQAYADAYDAAGQSIDGQLGLFGEFTAELSEDVDTADELLQRWQEQTEALGQYTENLKWAADSGLDDGLVASLADGSAESAAYLALIREEVEKSGVTINDLGEVTYEGVGQFNDAWNGTQEARETLQTTMADIQTDLEKSLKDLEEKAAAVNFDGFNEAVADAFDNVGFDGETIGKNFGLGLSGGISGSTGDVASAATDVGDEIAEATKSALDSHSPSRVAERIGEDYDEGLGEGVADNAKLVITAAKKMAENMTEETEAGAKNAVNAFDDEFKKITAKTTKQIETLKSSVEQAMASLPDSTYSVGQQMVNGMISGINNRSGSLYWTITSVVNNAIAKARAAAAVNSPSKKTTEIFEYVGEGMIVGIENKRQALNKKMQSVVDSALDVQVKNDITDRMASIDDGTLATARLLAESQKTESNSNVQYGDVYVTVYGAEGQDVRELADIVEQRIKDNIARKEAARQ